MRDIKEIFLKDYEKPKYTIKDVELLFELFEEFSLVTNVMSIKKLDDVEDIELDSIDLELEELWLNDLKLDETRYFYADEKLKILNVPNEFTLKIKNKIFPHANTELEGLYKSGDIFCTQNEPEGFRRITPYLDRPDVMSVFKTTIIADKKKYPILLSNGNKLQCHDSFDERHGVTWFDPHPKPSYLFALVAGDLGFINDSYTTMNARHVELNIYCDKGNEDKCHHAMKSLKEAFAWDEEKYGREYDLEIYNIVAVDSFNMGAMENKGLNIFNSHYVLANKEVATDNDFMGIQSVIAHEYFHNWTGNRITCRDWFQLTLKEGLTVFRDQCFSADLNSKEVQRINDVKSLRERQFVEDASPTSHPIQPKSYISMNNFYTATVYEKGAEVIRMIHTLLGEKKYRDATDLYFKTFDGQAVTTDDFLWAMSEGGSVDLTQFKRWYHQNGTPRLEVKEEFSKGVYKLILTQKTPYYYPLKIALIGLDGVEIVEKTLIISKESEEFVFENLPSKPYLSINRDFSAPIIIEKETKEFAFLMKHDTNSFTRYEATQNFGVETLEEIMACGNIDGEFIEAYGYVLDLDIELSYKALLLELPSISTLMQRQDEVDFEPIYLAKERLERELATIYKDKLLNLYTQLHETDDNIDAKSMGARAMKNRCLRILSALESEEIIFLAKEQYYSSKTMTDKIVALEILNQVQDDEGVVQDDEGVVQYEGVVQDDESVVQDECVVQHNEGVLQNEGVVQDDEGYVRFTRHPELDSGSSFIKREALNDFYKTYKNDTLVMNKYFAILSSSLNDGTLQKVIELQSDEAYDDKVPNLLRSLIGSFTRNYKHFHAKDGSGYKFVAQKILEIDKINPQMASSLAGAFKIYKKLNSTNKELMKNELECVVSTQSLSKNTYEIIHKIL